MTMNVE